MKINNLTKKTILSERPVRAVSFWERLRGMIGRNFQTFDAMIFERCSAVHTFFMSEKIDLVFVNRENRIVKAVEEAAPWRFRIAEGKAELVVELPAGTLRRSRTEKMDYLDLDAVSVQSVEEMKRKNLYAAKTAQAAIAPTVQKGESGNAN